MAKLHTLTLLRLLPLVAALGACAVGPDYHAPAAPAATSFTREPLSPGEGLSFADQQIEAQWWKAYGSPELDVLVQRALEHNPNVDAALANLKVAQQNVAAQRGYFFPTVQLGYNRTRQNTGNTLSSPLASGDSVFDLHTAQLTVGFVPDIFGGNRRQVESLEAQRDGQRFQLAALRVTIAANVVTAALQEAILLEQVKLVQEGIDVGQRQRTHLLRMREQGYSSAQDVAAIELALAQAQQLLPPLNKQIEQTRNLLAALCGELPQQRLAAVILGTVRLPSQLPLSVPSRLVAQRPDVRLAETQVHAANAQIGVAVANMLPQFGITAISGGSATAFASMFTGGNTIWALTGSVGQTLFAGGTLLARKRGAEAALQSALAQYQGVVITAFQNVADTLYALQTDGAALQAARDAESANYRLLDASQKSFEQGYSAEPALLGVRQSALQARVGRLQAYGTYLGDTVALYQALGGGWRDDDVAAQPSNQVSTRL